MGTEEQRAVHFSGIRSEIKQAYIRDIRRTFDTMRRIDARLLSESRNEHAAVLRETLPARVHNAIKIRHRHDSQLYLVSMIALAVFWVSPVVAPVLIGLWVAPDRGWWLFLLGPMEAAVSGSLVMSVAQLFAADDGIIGWWRWLLGAFALAALGVCTVAGAIVGMNYRHGEPGMALEIAAGVAVACLILLSVATLGIILSFWFVRFRESGLLPEEVLLLDFVALVSMAMEWESSGIKRQQLISRLEATARKAERLFRHVVSHKNSRLRNWAMNRGRQISAVFRRHEEKILEASSPPQRALITISLMNGLIYLLRGDWDSLLVVQPDSAAKTLIRRYGPRVALSLLLVALAFLLPRILPHVIKDAPTFQATVLVAAGFTLVRPDVKEAVETVKSGINDD